MEKVHVWDNGTGTYRAYVPKTLAGDADEAEAKARHAIAGRRGVPVEVVTVQKYEEGQTALFYRE